MTEGGTGREAPPRSETTAETGSRQRQIWENVGENQILPNTEIFGSLVYLIRQNNGN
jgi:hypothetical protein